MISSGVPVCTTSPPSRMRIRSASTSASTGSCVTRMRAPRNRSRIGAAAGASRRASARRARRAARRAAAARVRSRARGRARRVAPVRRRASRPDGGRTAPRRRPRRGARPRSVPGVGPADAVLAQTEGDVVERARGARTGDSPGTRRRPSAASGGTNDPGSGVVDDRPVDRDPALVDGEESRERAQQRGLAGAVRAEHREHLAVADGQSAASENEPQRRRGCVASTLTTPTASGRAGSRAPRARSRGARGSARSRRRCCLLRA